MPKRNLIWFTAIVALAVAMLWVTRTPPMSISDRTGPFLAVETALQKIQRTYYRRVEDSELMLAAVKGAVESLGEYEAYIAPDKVNAFQQRLMGAERGVGLRLEIVNGTVTVVGPVANSPAHRRGIFAGDRLLAIDGQDVAGLTLSQIEDRLAAGDAGSSVGLTVLRRQGEKEVIRLQREKVPLESVTGLFRDHNAKWVHMVDSEQVIAYLRVREFVPETPGELRRIVGDLSGLRAMVIDLRDNPGGLKDSAVSVADMLLDDGVILTVVGRDGVPQLHEAHSDDTVLRGIGVVLLVNENTASAAEIVAGALKLYDRAVIVGIRTRGKGYVQSVIPLGDGLGQASLTTAEYFVGRAEPIAPRPELGTWGVEPHVPDILLPGRGEQLARLRLAGEVMPRPRATTMPATMPSREAMLDKFLELDNQLSLAAKLAADEHEMQLLLKVAAAARARKTRLGGTQPKRP